MSGPEEDSDGALRERLERVAGMVRELEALPDAGPRDKAREVVEAVLELHSRGLERALELAGDRALTLADDELVSCLLLLHGIHPVDLEGRVRAALEKIRTGLLLRGGEVELMALEAEGTLRVRVLHSGGGCGSDPGKLKSLVEEALARAAPDVAQVEVELVRAPASAPVPASVPATLIPLESLRRGVSGAAGAARDGGALAS